MKNKDKVKTAVLNLLELFKTGDIPEKIAIVTNPDFDVPSSKWSLNNRLIQFFNGTMDSRGRIQWDKAGRKKNKDAKELFILAPRKYHYYLCTCGAYNYDKNIKKGFCGKCQAKINNEEIKKRVSFVGVPVIRAEDTSGDPLPYENILVPQHSFMNVVRAWGIEVKSSAFAGNAYGAYHHNEKIVLASPDEAVFYHELAHAAHDKLGLLRKKRQDPSNEIVAEFSAAVLSAMQGRKTNLGNNYEYLEHYAKTKKLTLEKAVMSLLSEIEKVIKLILKTEKEQQENIVADEKTSQEMVQHGVV